MIELQMVARMMKRAVVVAPFVCAALAVFGGWDYALSGAIGFALTIANLWLSARIIGGVAEKSPQLLVPAALATFTLGLVLLVAVALLLRSIEAVYFPVTGFTLIAAHLVLVLWEAAGAYDHAQPSDSTAKVRT